MLKAPFSVKSIISSTKQNKIKNFGHVKKEGRKCVPKSKEKVFNKQKHQ